LSTPAIPTLATTEEGIPLLKEAGADSIEEEVKRFAGSLKQAMCGGTI
jgi:hypothetical protein